MAKTRDPFSLLPFPLSGISGNFGFATQEKNTCVDALNVRGLDPTTNRLRGAQRCGITKYLDGTVNSGTPVQNIEHLTISAVVTPSTGSSARSLVAVAVAGGTVKTFSRNSVYVLATNGSGALDSTCPYVGSAILFNKIYYSDGVNWKFFNGATNTVTAMVASAGALPTDGSGNAPRLIASWRGRLVWAGLIGDPQNWFMSRQFAPLDYDYSPSSVTDQNAQQAVAGNNTETGYCPDIVNCLIPYSDDLLIFGGDRSIYQMTNDPAAGGQFDRISDTVGMAFGSPWCKDAYGNVYFFGSRGGMYMFHPTAGGSAVPVRISTDKIDSDLLNVDMEANVIRMVWDDRFQSVMVFITPIDGSETFNWVYDARAEAFWKDQFADATMNATAVHLMDGDDPDDRVVLLGAFDGSIRFVDLTAEEDDGQPISSYVILGPIQSNGARIRMRELRTVLGMNSDPVTLELFAGSSVEAAFDVAEPRMKHTIYPGRSPAIRSGAVAQAIYLKLSNSKLRESWQYEAIYAILEPLGRAAGRIV